jgi:predicted secreted protein
VETLDLELVYLREKCGDVGEEVWSDLSDKLQDSNDSIFLEEDLG